MCLSSFSVTHVYLERWQDQPSRHSQQALGVPSNLTPTKAILFWRGETAEIKQQPKGSDKNPTDCPFSEPQGNQKDSRLANASSQ